LDFYLMWLFGSLHILHDTPHRVVAAGRNFVYLNPFDICVTEHHWYINTNNQV